MDDYQEALSQVYIQTDGAGRITACDGGYTIGNITDFSQWTLIDEGTGDKYNLCQNHYFDGGLCTEDGFCRYVYEDGETRLRTEQEVQADRDAAEARKWRATRNYDPGEYLTVDGAMYRAVLPILPGAYITPGTNVEETTIEAEIAKLNEEDAQ